MQHVYTNTEPDAGRKDQLQVWRSDGGETQPKWIIHSFCDVFSPPQF